MNINDKRFGKLSVEFDSLDVGDTFMYAGELYLKIKKVSADITDEKIMEISSSDLVFYINCVCIKTGYRYCCYPQTEVHKVECEINILR